MTVAPGVEMQIWRPHKGIVRPLLKGLGSSEAISILTVGEGAAWTANPHYPGYTEEVAYLEKKENIREQREPVKRSGTDGIEPGIKNQGCLRVLPHHSGSPACKLDMTKQKMRKRSSRCREKHNFYSTKGKIGMKRSNS